MKPPNRKSRHRFVQRLTLDPELQVRHVDGNLLIGGMRCGQHLSSAVGIFWDEDLERKCRDALENGVTSNKLLSSRRPGGRIRLTIEPHVQDRSVTGVRVTATDMAEQEGNAGGNTELKDKMSSLSLLAAQIAHKLNNPLATMLNRIGGLLLEDLTRKELGELRRELEAIQEQIYAMSLITNALEAFRKESTYKFKLLDINEVVEKSVALSRLLQWNGKRDYRVRLDRKLAPVLGSEITLEQCFINIIRNALEAMPEGGTLYVSTRGKSGRVQVKIRDTGTGIAADDLERIFEPFFKNKDEGHVGLGLSIAYAIITHHRGFLTINSWPDKGTEVLISLPEAKL